MDELDINHNINNKFDPKKKEMHSILRVGSRAL